jgi:hypothetical protein
MIRAIAKQAETERERRAKVIHAEGELQASEKLRSAADVLMKSPASIQLHYLQTLHEVGHSMARPPPDADTRATTQRSGIQTLSGA